MSNDDTSPSSSPTSTRRASFSPGQAWSGLFGRSPTKSTAGSAPVPPAAFPNPIATAAANAQTRRRMSISTLGLSGNSPPQTSPFTAGASRRGSISSAGTGSTNLEESVVEEGDMSTTPTTPLARRMSFGARALRDRAGGTGIGMNGEGFNWADSFHSRAQRAATISVPAVTTTAASSTTTTTVQQQQRGSSVNTTTTRTSAPPQEIPKTPKVPDPFQERILKGDFYMD